MCKLTSQTRLLSLASLFHRLSRSSPNLPSTPLTAAFYRLSRSPLKEGSWGGEQVKEPAGCCRNTP